ncbi:sensor histidine kinase [Aquimarina sp. AU474]|uniref:sensor histidine kinase n=1 Tax=Aquimarina sp. AU474 TaxID=2108529 RepID=UPI001F170934|nr:histidine kinase [Aquimarina sp. AU474]
MRVYRITLAIIGLIIIIFNDTFGKLEGFPEFILFYFIIVCITIFHWLFVNIKFIINLKNEKAKTELMHLQSQVNPHFFFNMLNNLYGLVDKDSEKAKKLILKLSDMMRYSIYEGQKEYVTLQEEIDFISTYIELHKMRYHKKIAINFEVEVENKNQKIMPLLFIILVENAFKHGVEVLRSNAFINLLITSKENEISLKIENNFDNDEKSEKGIGLQNLTRRLELIYPKKHQLIKSINNEIYTAELTLKV